MKGILLVVAVLAIGCGGPAKVSEDQRYVVGNAVAPLKALGAKIAEPDPKHPFSVKAELPSDVAMRLTPLEVKEIAGRVQKELGPEGSVEVVSQGGQVLAKATPQGID